MHTIKHVCRSLALTAVVATIAFACEKNLMKRQTGVGNAQRARLCADAGASFDADRNECVCGSDQKWNGTACDLINQSPDINPPQVPAAAQAERKPQSSPKVAEQDHETKPEPPKPEPKPANNAAAEGDSADDKPGVGPETEAETTIAKPSPRKTPVKKDEIKKEDGETKTQHVANATAALTDDSRVRQACKKAKGRWLAAEQFCFCPKGEVLVGKQCRSLAGEVTDDTCRAAAHPGVWKQGSCQCADKAAIFSPARGGCVARRPSTDTTLRRICESSLNRGRWDVFEQRCRCPSGRVWNQELCQVQNRLTSKDVCLSDFNKGTWNTGTKSCDCPVGFFWIDQTCRLQRFVAESQACRSERNRGAWDEAKQTCICPGKTNKWRVASLSCEPPR